MTTIIFPARLDASQFEAKPLAPPSAQPLGPPITVRSRVDFTANDRKIVSGVWESEPGQSRWEFLTRGEIIHVISGAMTIVEDGMEPEAITAGATVHFPCGWRGEWNVTETLRKMFVVYKP